MSYQLNFSKDTLTRVFLTLIVIQLALAFIYILTAMIINRPDHTFNLDSEANIPAWFSTMQYFLIGIILLAENMQYPSIEKKTRIFIKVAGLGFIYLSMDEAGQVHETISHVLRWTGWKIFSGRSGGWSIAYGIIGLVVILWGRNEIAVLFRIFKSEVNLAVAGLIIVMLGSAVLEKLGYMIPRDGLHETLYKVEVVFEESFEMLGANIILLAAGRALLKCKMLNELEETKTLTIKMHGASISDRNK